MSLFKVRDFWSFDLDRLRAHSDDRHATRPNGSDCTSPPLDSLSTTNGRAQFIVSVGRFNSIGEQDVFVCAHLEGHIYIVQVPESDQRKLIRDNNGSQCEQTTTKPTIRDGVSERQLLAATSLNMILVDLKCGFFTSALKQSIAALGSNKLIILTVQPGQVDLLEEQLLSHELEVYIKLDLLINEFAFGVIVLNSHADGCLVDSSKKNQTKETDLNSAGATNLLRAGRQVVQQLHLPQRDKIVIQYANQFAFSLIDGKKIIGHFRVNINSPAASDSSQQPKQSQLKLDVEMSNYFGAMPMAHLLACQQTSASSLVIALSDHFIYCLPIDKLTGQARQNIVNRVALDLLSSNRVDASAAAAANGRDVASAIKSAGGQRYASDSSTEIDLEQLCEWQRELTSLPLQMQGLQRQLKCSGQQREQLSAAIVGQLMVMSRYSLDLFAGSGDHLWHQRFETPLIHLHSYTIETVETTHGNSSMQASEGKQPSKSNDDQKQALRMPEVGDKKVVKFNDQIVSLICSDSLRDDRSSLMIMKDDQMSWSAMLNSRPLQMWRVNLSQMSGLVATLDMRSGQLIASYLGTNMRQAMDEDQKDSSEVNGQSAPNRLVELERLNEPLFKESTWTFEHSKDEQRERLRVINRIELGPNDGIVSVCTSISLEPTSTSVIHDIGLTFEFDELFNFELNDEKNNQFFGCPARGVAEVQLGNCWPDRREALKVTTSFSLASAHSSKLTGVAAIEQFNESNNQTEFHLNNCKLMPKSLKVQQYLTFNETHSGTLHQEESFLLPISIVAQLKHVDYTSGDGQNLNDVLNNLAGYKRSAYSSLKQPAYLYCDLFLPLKCDLFMLLHEFIEGDLICRGRSLTSNQLRFNEAVASNVGGAFPDDESTTERKMETLESINLLAQSLDCRIRYMSPSPTGMARQTSEELVQPTMLSIALDLENSYPEIPQSNESSQTNQDQDKMVWIHICDLSRWNESDNIVADFIASHAKGWKKYRNVQEVNQAAENNTHQHKSRVLISVESRQPIAAVFVIQHLVERLSCLSATSLPTGAKSIQNLSPESMRNFFGNGNSHLAISSTLHDALLLIMAAYESDHKSKLNQLQLELGREFTNYRVVTDNLLSFAKRLPNLPDDLSRQVDQLMAQAKVSHQKLMNILDELNRYKKRDFELTKLPAASMINVELPKGSRVVPWPDFCRSFD